MIVWAGAVGDRRPPGVVRRHDHGKSRYRWKLSGLHSSQDTSEEEFADRTVSLKQPKESAAFAACHKPLTLVPLPADNQQAAFYHVASSNHAEQAQPGTKF